MILNDYEVLHLQITDTSQAPRAPDIYYRCAKCGEAIASQPDDSVGCRCGNFCIDVDYHRLAVDDFLSFQVVRRLSES